jgi:hypothetical protein
MVRAIDPKKVKNISDIGNAYKRKIPNVSLNLETGAYEVTNAAGAVVKTIAVEKGYDVTYVINRSSKEEDVESSGLWLKAQRAAAISAAEGYEAAFADVEEDLMRAVEAWKSSSPGAARSAQAIEVGRLQRELSSQERLMRNAQYTQRAAVETPVLRRTFVPMSFDDRKAPYPVYVLKQYLNLSKDRVVPIS